MLGFGKDQGFLGLAVVISGVVDARVAPVEHRPRGEHRPDRDEVVEVEVVGIFRADDHGDGGAEADEA